METNEIIEQIRNMPLSQRIYVLEKALQSIREEEGDSKVKDAAEALYPEYSTDKELTAFTDLDFEDFYETR